MKPHIIPTYSFQILPKHRGSSVTPEPKHCQFEWSSLNADFIMFLSSLLYPLLLSIPFLFPAPATCLYFISTVSSGVFVRALMYGICYLGYWFSRWSGMEPNNLPFLYISRWVWCCGLRNTLWRPSPPDLFPSNMRSSQKRSYYFTFQGHRVLASPLFGSIC